MAKHFKNNEIFSIVELWWIRACLIFQSNIAQYNTMQPQLSHDLHWRHIRRPCDIQNFLTFNFRCLLQGRLYQVNLNRFFIVKNFSRHKVKQRKKRSDTAIDNCWREYFLREGGKILTETSVVGYSCSKVASYRRSHQWCSL